MSRLGSSGETDEILVAQACQAPPGDLRAFNELMHRHQSRVQTNCRYLSGNEEDALDLAQEVLVKAYFNLDRFEGRSTFGTWIGRIKVNHCLNHLRRTKGKDFIDVDEPALESEPALHSTARADARVHTRDTRGRISEVLDGMSDSLRLPLLMRDMDGLSYQEIADELGVGLSAVKMRIKRAREEFRIAYGQGE
nr:RNA polymerase sigma factor [Candidatus Krumholzibacteria bacterium]